MQKHDIEELTELVLEESVVHKTYGNGIVTACDGKYLDVDFSGTMHKFPFPRCFEWALIAEDAEVQQNMER